MTWSLDQTVRVGDVACIPIVETVVSVRGGKTSLAVRCEKQPVLFLVFRNGDVIALDVLGRRCNVEDIEREYPDAIRRAKTRLAGNGG